MQQGLPSDLQPDLSHAHTQWQEALHLRHLWQRLLPQLWPEETHQEAARQNLHRGLQSSAELRQQPRLWGLTGDDGGGWVRFKALCVFCVGQGGEIRPGAPGKLVMFVILDFNSESYTVTHTVWDVLLVFYLSIRPAIWLCEYAECKTYCRWTALQVHNLPPQIIGFLQFLYLQNFMLVVSSMSKYWVFCSVNELVEEYF